MRSEQQSVRRSAADNANFADAAFDSALGGFQLKNHAAGNDAALDQSFDFLAGDGGENSLTIEEIERSEEHTSELQSHHDLVCRLLLEKKKKKKKPKQSNKHTTT